MTVTGGSGTLRVDSTEMPEVTGQERVSRTLGRYRLMFQLAKGGMATVYLARAEGPQGFEKLVALKRIHEHLSSEAEFVEMFLDEARIASSITHPNVCAIFDFGEADGEYYIAMEYLVGEPLSRVLKAAKKRHDVFANPRYPALMARLIADVCEGLHAAHELRSPTGAPLDIIHRDVTPDNLFVTYDGGIKVVDFGIATAAHKVHKTTQGTVKGKFAYMSPEYVSGRPIDRRTDVWSLGVVLWEALTLSRLFRRESPAEMVLAVMNAPILAPSQVNPNVPPEIDAIVAGCLMRDPNRRFATARDVGRALITAALQTGHAVGPADIAELMELLFPEGRGRKHQLIEIAASDAEQPDVADGSGKSMNQTAPRFIDEPAAAARKKRRALPILMGAAFALAVIVGLSCGAFGFAALGFEGDTMARFIGGEGSDEDTASVDVDPGASVAADPSLPAPEPVSPSAAIARPEPDPAPEVDPAVEDGEAPASDPEPEPAAHDDPPRALAPRRGRRRRASPRAASATAPSERGAPRAPASRGPGYVSVATPGGWAYVFVDGARRAQTPTRLTLPPGRHTIELRPFGTGAPIRRTVNVVSGATSSVVVRLED